MTSAALEQTLPKDANARARTAFIRRSDARRALWTKPINQEGVQFLGGLARAVVVMFSKKDDAKKRGGEPSPDDYPILLDPKTGRPRARGAGSALRTRRTDRGGAAADGSRRRRGDAPRPRQTATRRVRKTGRRSAARARATGLGERERRNPSSIVFAASSCWWRRLGAGPTGVDAARPRAQARRARNLAADLRNARGHAAHRRSPLALRGVGAGRRHHRLGIDRQGVLPDVQKTAKESDGEGPHGVRARLRAPHGRARGRGAAAREERARESRRRRGRR